jgi:hypothetical protein
MMSKTRIAIHNHQLVQVTPTRGHHTQQNELRIKDRDHDDMPIVNFSIRYIIDCIRIAATFNFNGFMTFRCTIRLFGKQITMKHRMKSTFRR